MKLSLPESIATYFEISNGADVSRLIDCFTKDASVTDEGHTHRGLDALESWIQETRKAFEFSVEPLKVVREDSRVTVTAQVTGNFPGSPIHLDHDFQLAGGRITVLEIH